MPPGMDYHRPQDMDTTANHFEGGMFVKTLVTFTAIGLSFFFSVAVAAAADSPQEKWIPLLNGKNLDGWTPKIKGHPLGENFGDTFRVEDGTLKVGYDKYDDF